MNIEYSFFWLTGTAEVMIGRTPADALNRKGYGPGVLAALDFYAPGDKTADYRWDKESRKWECHQCGAELHDHGKEENMNITPEQARALLANQSERGALWNADWNFTDRTAAIVREDSPGDEVMEIRFNGDDTAFSDGDLHLAAAAPELAQTIAGMEYEYRTEEWNGTYWYPCEPWTSDLSQYDGYTARKGERLVRRLVSPVEAIDGE